MQVRGAKLTTARGQKLRCHPSQYYCLLSRWIALEVVRIVGELHETMQGCLESHCAQSRQNGLPLLSFIWSHRVVRAQYNAPVLLNNPALTQQPRIRGCVAKGVSPAICMRIWGEAAKLRPTINIVDGSWQTISQRVQVKHCRDTSACRLEPECAAAQLSLSKHAIG